LTTTEDRKRAAVNFLQLARDGNRAAAEGLVAAGAKHHNPYFPAGMPALLDAISAAAKTSPERTTEVKRVLADGDYVAVHSHVRQSPDVPGAAVIHIFRFDDTGRIAELWDIGQPIPADNPNTDGMF
jgi:predicted SnoaL-like aldol condensation-catalyzing enzyme